jgi:hypothetical protein
VWNAGTAFALLPELLLGDMSLGTWVFLVPLLGTGAWGLMRVSMRLGYGTPL